MARFITKSAQTSVIAALKADNATPEAVAAVAALPTRTTVVDPAARAVGAAARLADGLSAIILSGLGGPDAPVAVPASAATAAESLRKAHDARATVQKALDGLATAMLAHRPHAEAVGRFGLTGPEALRGKKGFVAGPMALPGQIAYRRLAAAVKAADAAGLSWVAVPAAMAEVLREAVPAPTRAAARKVA